MGNETEIITVLRDIEFAIAVGSIAISVIALVTLLKWLGPK